MIGFLRRKFSTPQPPPLLQSSLSLLLSSSSRATTRRAIRREPYHNFPKKQQQQKQWLHTATSASGVIHIADAVQEALATNQPVVALESTIVAHGMPYPQNLETANTVESILRSKGVTPATIAIKNGECRIGLSSCELQDLAKAGEEGRAKKCSTRDLSLIVRSSSTNHPMVKEDGKNEWGATTVASTMVLSHAAGISTFVTGGIGGVHRSGEVTLDVSADLLELSRTPVVVVSAGIKSILDIPRTLEVLETHSVPTLSYQTNEFPAFFSSRSGVPAPVRVDTAQQVAEAYGAARSLRLPHGMLVAVPPPPNNEALGQNLEEIIHQALKEAEELGIQGQAVTPFLLKRVAETSGGDSLKCNIALVQHNATVGADIAIAISDQINQQQQRQQTTIITPTPTTTTKPTPTPTPPQYEKEETVLLPSSPVIVMGGTVMDIVAKPTGGKLLLGTSNPALCTESDGGVGRNVAEVLGRLGSAPLLYSAVGRDTRGEGLVQRLEQDCRLPHARSTIVTADDDTLNTATFLAILDGNGDLHTACADMSVHAQIQPPPLDVMHGAKFIVMDANPSKKLMIDTARNASERGLKVFFEPTSVPKAAALAKEHEFLQNVHYAFPNRDELLAMAKECRHVDNNKTDDEMELARGLLSSMSRVEAHLIITLGSDGVLLASKDHAGKTSFQHFSVRDKKTHVENSTGAGDSLCGAFIHGLIKGMDLPNAISFGMEAARISLECSNRTISPDLSQLRAK